MCVSGKDSAICLAEQLSPNIHAVFIFASKVNKGQQGYTCAYVYVELQVLSTAVKSKYNTILMVTIASSTYVPVCMEYMYEINVSITYKLQKTTCM